MTNKQKVSKNKKDTTVKKIDSRFSPAGKDGEKYLAGGKRVSMRLWEEEAKGYTIIEKFTAIEATSPPFEVHGRDE